MANFINRKQLQNASNEKIQEFFDSTIFHGSFSKEIKSTKNASYYKGSISNITLDGNLTNLCPAFLNVPTSSSDIPEGPCTFKCRMNMEELRGADKRYIVNLVGASLRACHNEVTIVNPYDITEQDLFDMWGVEDCQFIGFYHYDEESDTNVVDDIRKPNFDHIPFYPNDKEEKPIHISFPFELRGLKKDEYYLFNWKLSKRNKYNPYEIHLDLDKHQPKKIDPKWFIDNLFDDRHNDKSKNFGSATNFLDTLSKQLSAKESTFVYELLQNANDYPVEGEMVDVEFHITDNYLLFMHTGDKFNVRNISGICGINEKEKVANKKTIGYKGIGFKTVFLNNHYVYLRTGQYSFRFDEKASKIKRLKAPWPILPVWTEHSEVAPEVNSIFDASSKEFRVQIALRPDDKRLLHYGRNCYENLFKEVFFDSNIILFIPNINSVKVIINGEETRLCQRNGNEWIVNDYEQDIDIDLQALINKTIATGRSRIPEKYKDFEATKVSFACKHEGATVIPVDESILYCYLPTKASWGFPFLLNSDMIPKGDRNDIETEVLLVDDKTNFNKELTSIVGTQFFNWIFELLASRKYELSSIFSLIPDFEKCIKEHGDYKEYIAKFRDSFEAILETENIVPVSKEIFANVKYIVYDCTGLTTSGIMSDEEFFTFASFEAVYLPCPMLRTKKPFNKFLKRYAKEDLIFQVEDLHDMISNENFQTWLEIQENNDKFLDFLLERDLLKDFLKEKIFIEDECGKLYSVKDLYYDIDEHLEDLYEFSNHLCYLSRKTREYFADNEKWIDGICDSFKKFAPESFVAETLLTHLNKKDTIEKLHNEEVSLHFFHFLAKNNIQNDEIATLPFISSEGYVISDFKDRFVFFASSIGEEICEATWLSDVAITFLSSKYDTMTLKYFKDYLSVRAFSNEIIVKEIILSDDYFDYIQDAINEDYSVSESFVKYCFDNESLFAAGSLNNYAVNVANGEGKNLFVIPKDEEVFLPSSLYDTYASKEWIDNDWMYCLDRDYIDNVSNGKNLEFKEFLSRVFGVKEISDERFFKYVVKPHIGDINSNISGDSDSDGAKNIDFIQYLDDNYKLIFEKENTKNLFSNLTLLGEGKEYDYDIEPKATNVYVFDEELKSILYKDWFPSDLAYMCSSKYGRSKAIREIRAEDYSFSVFFTQVIAPNIRVINSAISTLETSVDFHNLVIEHKGEVSANELQKMQSAKVYLLNNAKPAKTSTGHQILSNTAKELAEKGLVEFSQLNIIDTTYNTGSNADYWGANLGNNDFTVTHFLKWVKQNSDRFSATIFNKEHNVAFWRWAKQNLSKSAINELPALPIWLDSNIVATVDNVIYLADSYVEKGGIEGYVKKFDSSANFISSVYIEDGEDLEEWRRFWTGLGVKSEIIHILIGTIIPKLDEIDEVTLPATIVKYRDELEDEFDDLPAQLTKLRVKAHDGNFYSLSACVYVNCTEQEEPFPFIDIPNQITFSTGEERSLIKEIFDHLNIKYIDNTTAWRHAKMQSYLYLQGDSTRCDLFRRVHFQFMDELAIMREKNIAALSEYKELDNVLILDENDKFVDPKTLTMSSIYMPFCDFQQYGIETVAYTSDCYNEECHEYVGKVFRSLNVHYDFRKADFKHLANRKFSFYFWTKYLQNKADKDSLDKLAEYIGSKEFSEVACIPTKDYMKKPASLYSPTISNFVKKTEDWENKIPLETILEVEYKDGKTMFDLLPFKKGLTFSDCLYALFSVHGKDTRSTIVHWAIEGYNEAYEVKVDEYREDEDALWTNTKNERVSIKSLYALERGNQTLALYFKGLDRILNPDYINISDFEKACEIFKIKTITDADLKVDPNNEVNMNSQLKRRLRISALVMAGRYNLDTWSETYEKYDSLIEQMNLWRCTAISLQYKDDAQISQSLKKFYYKGDTSDFYFVQDLDSKLVFTDFVASFIKYLGVPSDFDKDIIVGIMDSEYSALEMVSESNELKLNEDFMNKLDELIPGKKREMIGIEAQDNDALEESKRHTYTAQTTEKSEDNITPVLSPKSVALETEGQESNDERYDILSENNHDDDDVREAIDKAENASSIEDFSHISKMIYAFNGEGIEAVCEHYRSGTWVRGHYRNGYWVSGHWRFGASVDPHFRISNHSTGIHVTSLSQSTYTVDESHITSSSSRDMPPRNGHTTPRHPVKSYASDERTEYSNRSYTDNVGGNDNSCPYRPSAPKPFSQEDVRKFGSNGKQRSLEVLEPTQVEVCTINRILDSDLTSEQVADQNYLAQLRLFRNLQKQGMQPDESEEDFVRNGHLKNEHTIKGGKYIHKCSAAGGIMYLSPSIWNKIADDRCVVCVYLGAKANDFMYFNSIDDILEWIREDDIVIKLTGEEKADVVQELYSGILNGVKGTAYTMIRIASNEMYNSVFAPMTQDPNMNDSLTDDDI